MHALQMAALDAMNQKRANINILSEKKETLLDELSKVHTEIGYAKKDLEQLEVDYKNLVSREDNCRINAGCSVGPGNDAIKRSH